MPLRKGLLATLTGTMALGACATTPTEVCSADWISYRADQAMDEFGREVQPMLRTLRNASAETRDGGSVSPLMMVRLLSAVTDMISTFENSQALDDLQTISRQCDDPEILTEAFSDFLRDRGASPEIVRIVEDMSVLRQMMEERQPQ